MAPMRQGNLYVTAFFSGDFRRKNGGVLRLDAASNYHETTCVLDGMGAGNGISFSPEWDILWVADSTYQQIYRIILDESGRAPLARVFGVFSISMPWGRWHPDSNKVDSGGNLYQAMMHAGWILILNRDGIPVGNVLVPQREEQNLLNTPNLAIQPGSSEAYMVASDSNDTVVLTFPTLAPGQMLYSHM